jgi:uncharacterized membrane protein YeaQ/YmgE (transglycosylase-associated protein family)
MTKKKESGPESSSMGVIVWIFIGLIAGWLAHVILGGRGGIFGNIAVGLVGAIVGGFLFEKLNLHVMPDFWGNLITATIGAVIFLLIWRAIRKA